MQNVFEEEKPTLRKHGATHQRNPFPELKDLDKSGIRGKPRNYGPRSIWRNKKKRNVPSGLAFRAPGIPTAPPVCRKRQIYGRRQKIARKETIFPTHLKQNTEDYIGWKLVFKFSITSISVITNKSNFY